jgi:Protein of unknown function (DUF2934)
MNASENRIREIAYQIWESEGYLHGKADRHWELATQLVSADEHSNAVTDGLKSTENDSSTKPFMKLVKSVESLRTNESSREQLVAENMQNMQKEKRKKNTSRNNLQKMENDMETENSSKHSTVNAKKTFKEKLKPEDPHLGDPLHLDIGLRSDDFTPPVSVVTKRKIRVTEIE